MFVSFPPLSSNNPEGIELKLSLLIVLNMKLWHYIYVKWQRLLYDTANLETCAPGKHDLYESLMT